MTIEEIKSLIVDVPDFPKPGVMFKDITPIFENAEAFSSLAKLLARQVSSRTTHLLGIESRGFILAAAMSQHLACGLVLARKPGKLPRPTFRESYELEYGTDSLEIHRHSLGSSDRVVIVDDVLATGGTAAAAERLCELSGASVEQCLFLMDIPPLQGRNRLKSPVEVLF